MGTPGVPWNVPKRRILETIKARKGVITYVCKDLDAAHETVLRHINKDPELKAALDAARNEYDDDICDRAEDILLHAVTQREDLSSGLRAAQFVLNNKGRKRGYIPPTMASPQDQVAEKNVMERIADGIALLRSAQPSEQNTSPDETQTCEKPLQEDPDKSE